MKHPLIPAILFSLLASASLARGQYVWTNNTSGGTKSWTLPTSWQGANVPGTPATLEVQFNNNTSGSSYTVLLDIVGASQTLTAGMLLRSATSTTGHILFDLNAKLLVFDGGALVLNPTSGGNSANRTQATFSNGTVRLGTVSNAAQLIVGTTETAGSVTAGSVISTVFTSTLDTANTSSISVASNEGNNVNNVALDLSAATLVSGAEASTLAVGDFIAVGQNLHTGPSSGRDRYGLLKMGVVGNLTIGNDLIIGQNLRTSATTTDANGTLEFSTAQAQGELNLTIGRDLRLGVGAGATGTVTGAPADLHLAIGSETDRGGVLYAGYKNVAATNASGNAQGTFESAGGTLSAYLTELRVGQNNHASNGTATGTLDFADSRLDVLDISGEAAIGKGVGAAGTLLLSGGEASSASLTVGDGTGSTRSVLGLNETLWTVGESLRIGALGDLSLAQGARIDLVSDAAPDFNISGGGTLTVYFESADAFWGVRMAGSGHAELFQGYITSGALIGAGAYGNQAEVFTDGAYTYFGITAIPEPSAVALLALGVLGTLAMNRRKRP